MPKTVLVFCSNNEGIDFSAEENQKMLKKLLGDDYIPIFGKIYPQDLPVEDKYDAVLFAGCNLLTWLFKKDYENGMKKLSNNLKKDGIIIFVESEGYIKKLIQKFYARSIPLDEMKLLPTSKDDGTGLKQKIIESWEKIFELDTMYNYFVYKVKGTDGGIYKRKNSTRHKGTRHKGTRHKGTRHKGTRNKRGRKTYIKNT